MTLVDPAAFNDAVSDYWAKHYQAQNGCCVLCGNRGFVDTSGTTTAAGTLVGRISPCICPNGQIARASKLKATKNQDSSK